MDDISKDSDVVRFIDWRPSGVVKCIAASSRHFVGLMEDRETVLKYPFRKTAESMDALDQEAARYRHIGSHPNIVQFKGIQNDGLLFEYCEDGPLVDAISQTPDTSRKLDLAQQIVRGLIHLHEKRFIHCDLNVHNVFVTKDLIAKIGDIQGQLYGANGEILMPTMSEENAKSRHPDAGEDEFTVRTDIFALGTLLYHLWGGEPPFSDLDEYSEQETIRKRFEQGQFPITTLEGTGFEEIVLRCWKSEYTNATQVLSAIEALQGAAGFNHPRFPSS